MHYRLILPSILLTLLPLSLPAQAQQEGPEVPDFSHMFDEDLYVPKNTVTFGYHVLSSGGKVRFSGAKLGTVPSIRTIAPVSDGAVERIYDDGSIQTDLPRSSEVDSNGTQTSTPGGRFQDSSITTATDYLSYTPGATRNWDYRNSSQVTSGGDLAFHTYSSITDDRSIVIPHNSKPPTGIDLEVIRPFKKISKHLEFNLTAGIALNDIHNKVNRLTHSTLVTTTDVYSLNGQTAVEAPYYAPSFDNLTDSSGNVVTYSGLETTTALSATPYSSTTTIGDPGSATVQDFWNVKGAYYMLHVGPMVRATLTERLSLRASLGIAGAYAGTKFSLTEQLLVEGVTDVISTTQESNERKFLPGYYADLSADLMLTDRTGFFAGVSLQKFGDYTQSLEGRAAEIDLGSSAGIHGGISFKF
ncbi:MAG: hypothetical protein PHQ04_06780 [Opitutaceae bacterium]|nr:hypothetical protein [Opitutaceae bacterium]